MRIRFSTRELRDFAVAWLALGLAFTVFLEGRVTLALFSSPTPEVLELFAFAFARSLLTVGVGFLLHELAHKVVAVRFGQVAEFRADYGMLAVAVMAAFGGFLFAAPGAVHHRGRITDRENGLIALAGPATNVGLAILFRGIAFLPGYAAVIGDFGFFVNLILAGFNMIPVGPLDGRKVLDWNSIVFAVSALLTIVPAAWLLFG